MHGDLARFGGPPGNDPLKALLFADAGDVGVRLSLDPLRSVPTSDQTSKGTVYVVPHRHAFIPLFNGRRFVPREVPWECSGEGTNAIRRIVAVSLAGLSSSTVQDLFGKWDSAKGRVEVAPIQWNSTTARFSALPATPWITPDGLGLHRGRLVRPASAYTSGAILMPDWLYLGTVYLSGSGTTDDSGGSGATPGARYVCNPYNAVARSIQCCPGYVDGNNTTEYTTTSTTFVAANGGTGATLSFVTTGFNAIDLLLTAVGRTSGNSAHAGIGLDSTSAYASTNHPSTLPIGGSARAAWLPSAGYHSATLLIQVNSGTGTFTADIARIGSTADPKETYIAGVVWG